MEIATAKVVGTPNQFAWTQVHKSFSPTGQPACLVSVLSVSLCEEESDGRSKAGEVGRDLLSGLHEDYFKETAGLPLKALKENIEKLASRLSGAAVLEVAASVIVEEYIYFCVFGKGEVLLWREGNLVNLLNGDGKSTVVCSGIWRPDDVFVLGTVDFFRKMEKAVLKQILEENFSLQETADKVATLSREDSSANTAVALVKMPETFMLQKGDELVVEVQEKAQSAKKKVDLKGVLVRLVEKLPDKTSFVPRQPRAPRTAVSVGVILLVILAASLVFGARQKKQQDFKSSYEGDLVRAETAYNDSVSQKDINLPLARSRFTEAKDAAEDLISRGIKDQRLDGLKAKIDQDSVAILGKVEGAPTLFLDLYLVRSDINATGLSLDGETIAVLDGGGKRVIAVSASKKEATPIAGSEKLGVPRSLALNGDLYYVLSDQGVLQTSPRGGVEIAVKPDPEWGNTIKISVFGSSVYLLDQKGEIWRYGATAEGFANKQKWLKEEGQFSDSVDMAIDGSVWVLSSQGKIDRFTRGTSDAFRVSGMSEPFNNPTALYTDEKLESVFILDKGNKRVIQLSKNGEYQKEYVGEGIENTKDLVVSKKEGKIFLLQDTKILELRLR